MLRDQVATGQSTHFMKERVVMPKVATWSRRMEDACSRDKPKTASGRNSIAEVDVLTERVRSRRPVLEAFIEPDVLSDRSAQGHCSTRHPLNPTVFFPVAHGLVDPGSSYEPLTRFSQGHPAQNPANTGGGPWNEIDKVAHGTHGLGIIEGAVDGRDVVSFNANIIV
jgi:hypothetical protein